MGGSYVGCVYTARERGVGGGGLEFRLQGLASNGCLIGFMRCCRRVAGSGVKGFSGFSGGSSQSVACPGGSWNVPSFGERSPVCGSHELTICVFRFEMLRYGLVSWEAV